MSNGIQTTLAQIAHWLDAELQGADVTINGVSTDSRTLKAGQLFVALRGPNFDGHDHVQKAQEAGAVAALVEHAVDCELPQVIVADTRLALGQLAAAWRRHCGSTVVGVTGSNGKTTVKEMLAAICSAHGTTLATQGNFNNDIGMPLTLLRLQPEHRYAVIEMGASAAGEIDYLTHIAQPKVALITNAAGAHLEGFGSLDGVAHAKGEIFKGLAGKGSAIINADDQYRVLWQELAAGNAITTFGLGKTADVSAIWQASGTGSELVLKTPQGGATIQLQLPGRHNVMNALTATAAALALGIPLKVIVEALSTLEPVKGRLQPRKGHKGAQIIDDSYNANPESLRSGIQVLAACKGRRYLAMGDMAELGEAAADLHAEAGREARRAGIDRLYATGVLSRHAAEAFGDEGRFYDEQVALIDALKHELAEDVTVLVKGSRSAHMERVAQALANGGDV